MSTTKALLKVAADAAAAAAAGWKLNWHRYKNDVFWGLQFRRSEPLEDFFASFRGRRCGEVDWTVILFFRFVVIVRLVVVTPVHLLVVVVVVLVEILILVTFGPENSERVKIGFLAADGFFVFFLIVIVFVESF